MRSIKHLWVFLLGLGLIGFMGNSSILMASSSQSHSTHFDSPKGPGLPLNGRGCYVCHADGILQCQSRALFADMNFFEVTNVCDNCHSPAGAFDGVAMAKTNWDEGIYEEDGTTLKSGKGTWCATCHDDAPACSINSPQPVVTDNTEATYVGTWPSYSNPSQQYGSDFQYDNTPGGGDTATWTPDLVEAGDYRVYAWWVAQTNRATDAPYTIHYDGGSQTVDVNQKVNGGQWNLLGTYPFATGASGYVELSDDADGVVIADAVRFERVQPALSIVDNDDPEASITWPSHSNPSQQYGSDFQYDNTPGGGDTATWTPYLNEAGIYRVYAWWIAQTDNRATNAPYTIHYDGGSQTVDVNQKVNGGQWNLLGTYPFAAGASGYVELSDDADGVVIADAIKFDASGIYAPNVIGDHTDYGFYITGHKIDCLSCHDASTDHIDHEHRTYNNISDNYQSGYRLKSVAGGNPMSIPRSSGDPIANWEDFALCFDCHDRTAVLGTDENDVSGTNFWNDDEQDKNSHTLHLGITRTFDSDWDGIAIADSAYSCVACHNVHGSPTPAMIRHGELISTYGTTDKVPALNFGYITSSSAPNIDPDADLMDSIGGIMAIATAYLPDNGVCDACHGPLPYYRGPELVVMPDKRVIVDNDSVRATYVGTWTVFPGNPEKYGENAQYNEAGVGDETATFTPDLPEAGHYRVYAWWVSHTNRATDAPYTIHYDGGSVTIDVNQEEDGGQWNLLGTFPFAAGTSGSVVLSDDANEYVIADAVKFAWVNPDVVTVDNPEATYVGTWTVFPGDPGKYGENAQYNEAGVGDETATFTPNILETGSYRVYAWWPANANRATDAPYTIHYDGGSVIIDVNQEENGGQWNLLGTFPFAVGTSGSVVLSDDANDYVIADAVRFVRQ